MYVKVSCSTPVFNLKVYILHIAGYNNKSNNLMSVVYNGVTSLEIGGVKHFGGRNV